jgi:hypothetical protein
MFSHCRIVLTLIVFVSVCVFYNASPASNARTISSLTRNKEPLAGSATSMFRHSSRTGRAAIASTDTDSWFTSSDVSSGDDFGSPLALSGNTVVVGAPRASTSSNLRVRPTCSCVMETGGYSKSLSRILRQLIRTWRLSRNER